MTPGNYNLGLYRGDSYQWEFHLWQDATKTTAVDLTGATVEAEIRDKPGGSTVFALTTTVTLPNVIDVEMPAALWAAFALTAGVWDLEVTAPDGTVSTYVAGKVTVTADVTNSSSP
jgi:nitrogen fixation protein FixH